MGIAIAGVGTGSIPMSGDEESDIYRFSFGLSSKTKQTKKNKRKKENKNQCKVDSREGLYRIPEAFGKKKEKKKHTYIHT